jgi:hypothetical protein
LFDADPRAGSGSLFAQDRVVRSWPLLLGFTEPARVP